MSAHTELDVRELVAPPEVKEWQRKALTAGGVLAILSGIGFVMNAEQAMHSYLIGFMLILGLTLGPLGFLMVWHLTGGGWGVGIRRIFEAAIANLPLVALAFIPLLFGLHANYPWARHEVLETSEHIAHLAHSFFPLPFFIFRAVLYFVAWGALAWYLLRWSGMQDDRPAADLGGRYRALSGGGLVLYFWTLTFATVDWVMSAAIPWFSSLYALIFAMAQGMSGLAFAVIVGRALRNRGPMVQVLRPKDFHDYGKFLLMFVMVWAWFNFSQWLLMWSANLPEEIHFYLARSRGGWEYVTWLLGLGHFAIPFALLLSQPRKQNPDRLVKVAVWLLFMRFLDIYWNLAPNYSPGVFRFSWMDAVIPLAMLALWVAFFFRNLLLRPLVAAYDPQLKKMFEG
ncbi:MAG: hypothetical protein AB7O65_02575, partial [Candidatus Korobacteraceae bacterium]